MEEGPERELLTYIFRRVKRIKGLTTVLDQQAGVNGKWLKPDEPRNISSHRLLRIIIHTANFLGREQFKKDVNQAIDFLFDTVIPHYLRILASKHRQRPPWLRRRSHRDGRCMVLSELLEPYCKAIQEHRNDGEPNCLPTSQC